MSTFLSLKNDLVARREAGSRGDATCAQPFSRESLSSGWLKAPRNENFLLGIPPREVSVLARFYGLEKGDTKLLNDPFSQYIPLRTRSGRLLKWEERAEARAVGRSPALQVGCLCQPFTHLLQEVECLPLDGISQGDSHKVKKAKEGEKRSTEQ